MTQQVEVAIRGPEAFRLALRALEQMEKNAIFPTPLNYELCLHALYEPDGAIGKEFARILKAGEGLSDAVAEDLAVQFLPRLRLNEEIRDAGDQLTRQLEAIGAAISAAQRSTSDYGKTLQGASAELSVDVADPTRLKQLIDRLASSTLHVRKENSLLESRLVHSTDEVKRLRDHLEQVRRDAMTDALTNLANRKAFDEALNRATDEARAAGKPISVALIDIDHFKRFNDTWGHQTGDQVIRYVAAQISRTCVHPRLAARYGGEEFALMFPGETSATVAGALDALREEISSRTLKRRSTAEDLGIVTVSAGVAQLHPDESPTNALGRADEALYASKRAGRNRTTDAEPAKAA
jgi:diguanylate cyclase